MVGVGVFLPIAAVYDRKKEEFGIYFFDMAGAQFKGSEYACAGSGSERIRGVFEYLSRTKGTWSERSLDDVMVDVVGDVVVVVVVVMDDVVDVVVVDVTVELVSVVVLDVVAVLLDVVVLLRHKPRKNGHDR